MCRCFDRRGHILCTPHPTLAPRGAISLSPSVTTYQFALEPGKGVPFYVIQPVHIAQACERGNTFLISITEQGV